MTGNKRLTRLFPVSSGQYGKNLVDHFPEPRFLFVCLKRTLGLTVGPHRQNLIRGTKRSGAWRPGISEADVHFGLTDVSIQEHLPGGAAGADVDAGLTPSCVVRCAE